jgi:putative FmdB family regulatory protein
MPTYAYVCGNCHHEFDAFQSITAKPLRECPACGKNALRRLIGTGAGIIFKGSGFYCTDYRSDGYKNAAKSETGGSSTGKAAEKKPDAKSETTSETKSEPKEPNKKKSE